MRHAIMAALLLLLTAQGAQAAPLTPAQARAVVDEAALLIAKNYVFPDRRAGIVAQLKQNEAAGRYDAATSGDLVERLGADMAAAGHDHHLWIHYDPGQNRAMRNPSHSQGNAFFEREAARRNQGYEAMRILPGNVRYVDLTGFIWGKNTARTVADVARFLSDGDAIIVDLRENGGGSAEAVQALISYFLPPDNRVLMQFHEGANGAGKPTRVLTHLGGPRLTGKPLYVLTSGNTASAAEEFCYHVKLFHLGTLVGETTVGAANNNTLYPVGTDYVVSVSTDRPEHPVSHTNWEGTGVPPDAAAPRAGALDQAQLLALKALAAKGGDYAWPVAALEARLNPLTPDAAALASYAGSYGERTIRLENGVLTYQRQGRNATAMTLLAPDLFAFANDEHTRARFRRENGLVTGFDIVRDDGETIAVARSP